MKINNLIVIFVLIACLISCKPKDGFYTSLDMALKYPQEVTKLSLAINEDDEWDKKNRINELPVDIQY